jgi:TonB-dependent Receptor Plug Domain
VVRSKRLSRRLPLVRSAALVALAAFATTRTSRGQSPGPSSSSGSGSGNSSGSVDPPVEVTVHGMRSPGAKDIGASELRAQDARLVPGTFGDPLQAIAALPGVAVTASGLPYFYVRGAPPADTGYFLDGIPLPALYHIGPGPSYVPQPLLDRIEFFPGAAPARFGRFAGGAITATTLEPSAVARGEASLRLFDASVFVESPLDSESSVLVAGRYGYPDVLLSIFAPSLSLGYGDYTLRINRRLGWADSVSLFVIGGYDHLVDGTGNLPSIDSQFHRIDLRYDHRWTSGTLRVASTIGYDQSSRPLSTESSSQTERVHATSGRLRVELDQRLGRNARLSAGADANSADYSYAFTGTAASTLPIDAEQIGGAYADVWLRPSKLVELTPGIRVDGYRSNRKLTVSVEPRFLARVALTPDLRLVSTLGIARQPPSYIVPVPGLRIDPAGGLQATYHIAQGIEIRLPYGLRGSITGFFDADRNTSDYVSGCGSVARACSIVDRVNGRTYGMELLLQRPFTKRLAGWVAYTLSRAERWIGSSPYLSPFDRTHVVSAVLDYDFGSGIHAGVRGTYYTGRPDIPSFFFSAASPTFAFGPGQLPQHRLPPFYRIDLRAEKRWSLGERGHIAVVFDFFNATFTKEAINFRCNVVAGLCSAQEVGPIALPSIGLEAGF